MTFAQDRLDQGYTCKTVEATLNIVETEAERTPQRKPTVHCRVAHKWTVDEIVHLQDRLAYYVHLQGRLAYYVGCSYE